MDLPLPRMHLVRRSYRRMAAPAESPEPSAFDVDISPDSDRQFVEAIGLVWRCSGHECVIALQLGSYQ